MRAYSNPFKGADTITSMGQARMISHGDSEIERHKADRIAQYEPPDESASKNELALERTSWALERTLLANERNFSAWFRTGLAGLAAGLGIGKLLGSLDWPLLTKSIGLFCVASAGIVSVIAFTQYYRMHDRLKQEDVTVTPLWLMAALVTTLLVSVGIAGILLLST